jgi:hypothetical protein
VISALIWKVGGFKALSIVYIVICLAAFVLFFKSARRWLPFEAVLGLSLLVILLITDRREIRPEGLSSFFMGLYFYLLTRFREGSITPKLLFLILLPVQLIWVNTHIFFFMGPLITAAFLCESHLSPLGAENKRLLLKLCGVSLLINLINPSFLAGALTPLNIFKGLGYNLAENQTIFFMLKRFPQNILYPWTLMLAAGTVIIMFLGIKAGELRRTLPFLLLFVFALAAGFKAVRLIPYFGLLFIPLSAICLAPYFKKSRIWLNWGFLAIGLISLGWQQKALPHTLQIGLFPGINESARFYRENNLKGPIFSNYDIGGYLIFHLAPEEKVFVDNRQEAFPPEFFKNTYIPMQEDSARWEEELAKHNFNVIYFYRHDLTPWGQTFLIKRVQDPLWAPIFVDDFTIIFVKRTPENADLIGSYEIPQNRFGITGK